jgi:hypothetical protein
MPNFRAISGPRAKLFINNIEAGWATNFSATETITQVPIEVLGNIDAEEIEAVGRMVNCTASFVRIKLYSLQQQGFWPRGVTNDIIEWPAMDAELYDQVSDEPICRVTHLRATTRSWTIDRRGLMTVNAAFVGIRLFDEQES